MTKIDLSQYGITGNTEIIYNPDYDTLLPKRPNPVFKAMKSAA